MFKKIYSKIASIILAGLVLSSCIGFDYPSPYPEISPVKLSTLSGKERACAVAFVIGDSAFVGLGRNSKAPLKDFWKFDINSGNWSLRDTFPGIARINSIAEVVNNEAYIGLGYNPKTGWAIDGYLKDFYKYNPSTSSWTRLADFPQGTTNNCVSFVYKDEIYVVHGFESHLVSSSGFSNSCFKYSPANNEWTKLNDFPGYKRASAAGCTEGNRISGGTGWATWDENDWWEYFPETDSWEKKEYMPDKGRVNALAFSVSGRFFLGTGRYWGGEFTGGEIRKDIYEYDSAKDRWYFRGEIPDGKRENAIQFVYGDKVFIGFGENDSTVLGDLWSFEPLKSEE